jgi:hypothetical protein
MPEGRCHGLDARRDAAVEFAEVGRGRRGEAGHGVARFEQHAAFDGGGADHRVPARPLTQTLFLADAVLQRAHHAHPIPDGLRLGQGSFGVLGLGEQDHQVEFAERIARVGNAAEVLAHHEIAVNAADAQAVGLDGVHVAGPANQGHVLAGASQHAAEDRAQAAGAANDESHGLFLLFVVWFGWILLVSAGLGQHGPEATRVGGDGHPGELCVRAG